MRMLAQMCPLYNGVWRSPKYDVAVEFGRLPKGGIVDPDAESVYEINLTKTIGTVQITEFTRIRNLSLILFNCSEKYFFST